MSRTASRLAATVLAAGAIVTAAALPASAADTSHGRHAGFGYSHGTSQGRQHDQRHDRRHDQRHNQRHDQQDVVIGAVHHVDRGARSNRALNDEWVTVTNDGRRAVSLDRWTLTDSDHNVYRFSHVTLRAHESLRVHTGMGRDTSRDLYQDRRTAVWDRSGDSATLRDARGHVVDSDSWGHGRR